MRFRSADLSLHSVMKPVARRDLNKTPKETVARKQRFRLLGHLVLFAIPLFIFKRKATFVTFAFKCVHICLHYLHSISLCSRILSVRALVFLDSYPPSLEQDEAETRKHTRLLSQNARNAGGRKLPMHVTTHLNPISSFLEHASNVLRSVIESFHALQPLTTLSHKNGKDYLQQTSSVIHDILPKYSKILKVDTFAKRG